MAGKASERFIWAVDTLPVGPRGDAAPSGAHAGLGVSADDVQRGGGKP
jgi:hypothetical protein